MNGDQVPFQNTLPNQFVSTQVTEELKIGRPSPEWRPSVVSKYSTKLICSTKVTKELSIGRFSPEWQPSDFSNYSTKFVCFLTGHKRTENWHLMQLSDLENILSVGRICYQLGESYLNVFLLHTMENLLSVYISYQYWRIFLSDLMKWGRGWGEFYHHHFVFVLLFPTVRLQMSPQVACKQGCIVAQFAFVRLFPAVYFQMFPQIAYFKGCIITLVTLDKRTKTLLTM